MKEPGEYIIYLISGTLLLILSVVVSFRRKNANRYTGFLLAAYFWSFFLAASISYIVQSPLVRLMPHFFRSANIFLLLIMPFSWLYFRETLRPGNRSWKDLIHLIPVLVYIIDYLPFFILSGQEKLIILDNLSKYGVMAQYAEGWFMPAGGHNLIRYAVMLVYWFAQGRLLIKAVRLSSNETGNDFVVQRKWLNWLHFSESLLFLPALFTLILGRVDIMVSTANMFGLVAALIQGFFLLVNPQVLYGIPEYPTIQKEDDPELQEIVSFPETGSDSYQKEPEIPGYVVNLDEVTLDNIGMAIEKVMNEKKLYLDTKLKISDLALATGFMSYKLSAYFNSRCNQTFNDFVNQLRVEYCANKLDSGEHESKTLEALSKESGFHSRSTFIRAFKKFRGMTPSEYIDKSH
jgi:AraC-like DNA-binding protein